MVRPEKFKMSHTFRATEISSGALVGPYKTVNGIKYSICCKKTDESNWQCCLDYTNYPPSLRCKIEFKIKTKNGVETVGTRDGRIEAMTWIRFLDDPKYFVNGKMKIECHVEVYEIEKNIIRKPPTVIENETEIGFRDQESLLAVEEKELQTAISLSKKEFEKAMAKEQQKKKETLSCTICLLEYGEEGDRTPRVLDCGHTLCLGCCKQIAQPHEIQCPFCRVVTHLTGRSISNLPKNYLVLSM